MDLSFDFLSAVFFAGIFLSLALIALLSPRENSAESGQDADSTDIRARQNKPKPDLTSNAYRIWLANKYKITKNELFEKYECREELFDTLDDALSFAHDLEPAPTSAEEIYYISQILRSRIKLSAD